MDSQTTARRAALALMADSARTGHVRDGAAQAVIVRGAGSDREWIVRRIVANRLAWLDWQTVTQRRWQRETRRPGRARHHDSVAIRERWVRCGA